MIEISIAMVHNCTCLQQKSQYLCLLSSVMTLVTAGSTSTTVPAGMSLRWEMVRTMLLTIS